MDSTQKAINELKALISVGLDNNDPLIVAAGDSLSGDELANSFAIYAPFGDVDLTTLVYNKAELASLTLASGAQIFGRVLEVSVASGTLVVYVKK